VRLSVVFSIDFFELTENTIVFVQLLESNVNINFIFLIKNKDLLFNNFIKKI
jgi:hypothetical protein